MTGQDEPSQLENENPNMTGPDFGLICGTRRGSLPLLPSGPGGVREHPSHRARSLTCWPVFLGRRAFNVQTDGSTRARFPSTLLAEIADVLCNLALLRFGCWGTFPGKGHLIVVDTDFQGGDEAARWRHGDDLTQVHRSVLGHDVD